MPGTQARVEAQGDKICLQLFESFVGRPFDGSGWDFTWLGPSEQSWRSGDREVVCMLGPTSGTTTGSARRAAPDVGYTTLALFDDGVATGVTCSHTDTCLWESAVNGARLQSAHRWRRRRPAMRAIRSSSAGQT